MGCDRMSPRELCSEAEQAAGEVHSSSPLPGRCLLIPTVLGREGSSSGLLGQEQGNHGESQDGAWVSWWRLRCLLAFCTLRALVTLFSFAALHQCSQSTAQLQSLNCPPQAHSQASPAPVAGYLEPWGCWDFCFKKSILGLRQWVSQLQTISRLITLNVWLRTEWIH